MTAALRDLPAAIARFPLFLVAWAALLVTGLVWLALEIIGDIADDAPEWVVNA